MRKALSLTQDRLREVMSYDPVTGIFVWTDKAVHPAKPGTVAGRSKDGYVRVGIDRNYYQASSLAWFWVHGEWPTRLLRFKDGDRGNTAIANLEYGKIDSKDVAATNAYRREYWRNNPEKRREKQRKAYYGITPEQYGEMLIAQNGVCACCHKPETQFANGKPLPLCVDHCHAGTGVRGLLCRSCNTGLGLFKDDIEILRRAAAYLEAHAAKPETNVIPLAGRRIGQS